MSIYIFLENNKCRYELLTGYLTIKCVIIYELFDFFCWLGRKIRFKKNAKLFVLNEFRKWHDANRKRF